MPPKRTRRASKNYRESNLQKAHMYFSNKKETINELMNKDEYVEMLNQSLDIINSLINIYDRINKKHSTINTTKSKKKHKYTHGLLVNLKANRFLVTQKINYLALHELSISDYDLLLRLLSFLIDYNNKIVFEKTAKNVNMGNAPLAASAAAAAIVENNMPTSNSRVLQSAITNVQAKMNSFGFKNLANALRAPANAYSNSE